MYSCSCAPSLQNLYRSDCIRLSIAATKIRMFSQVILLDCVSKKLHPEAFRCRPVHQPLCCCPTNTSNPDVTDKITKCVPMTLTCSVRPYETITAHLQTTRISFSGRYCPQVARSLLLFGRCAVCACNYRSLLGPISADVWLRGKVFINLF